MNTVATEIQALATIASLSSDIDALFVLDAQVKLLTEKVKHLKEYIANAHGEGTHKGELHSVTVTIADVKGTVDYQALCVEYGITEESLNKFRKAGSARITVTPKK